MKAILRAAALLVVGCGLVYYGLGQSLAEGEAAGSAPASGARVPPAAGVITPTVSAITAAVSPTLSTASADGDQVGNNGRVLLDIRNAYSAMLTATVAATYQAAGLTLEDLTAAIPAGQERILGPFDPNVFNASGYISVTWSTATSVTFATMAW